MADRTAWNGKTILLAVAGVGAALIFAFAGLAAIGFVWAASLAEEAGEPVAEPVARTRAARTAGAETAAAGGPDRPLRVEVELEDGEFEVRPGPPGSGVTVDGTYIRAHYELIEEHTPAGAPGGPATRIRLRPAHPWFVRLAGGALADGHPHNALTVTIPPDVPVALTLRLRAGESWTDLGGLMLTELDAELVMGEHRLGFDEPLAARPRRVFVEGGMGEIRIERLGNARASEIGLTSRMGSFTADLGGAWSPDTVADLTAENVMGELRIHVPDAVRVAPDSETSAVVGERGRILPGTGVGGEGAHVRLRLSNKMGETRVRRY